MYMLQDKLISITIVALITHQNAATANKETEYARNRIFQA